MEIKINLLIKNTKMKYTKILKKNYAQSNNSQIYLEIFVKRFEIIQLFS